MVGWLTQGALARAAGSVSALAPTPVAPTPAASVKISIVRTTVTAVSTVLSTTSSPSASSSSVPAWIAGIAAFGAILAATAAVIVGVLSRRTGKETIGQVKADSRSRRYQEAAEHLGHEKAAVRLAGVHAMAVLADEWPERRQVCVDVLCAYLRMPSKPAINGPVQIDERQVLQSIVAVIAEHVSAETVGVSWSDCLFDFRNVRFEDCSFHAALFNKYVTFRGAQFVGGCSFYALKLLAGASFDECIAAKGLWSITSLDLPGASNANITDLTVMKGGHLAISAPKLAEGSRILITNYKAGTRIEGELSIWTPPDQGIRGLIHLASMKFGPESTFKMTIGDGNPALRLSGTAEMPRIEVADSWFEDHSHVNIHQALIDSLVLTWSRNHLGPEAETNFSLSAPTSEAGQEK